MIRDFSESAKQKLLAYVKDVTETTVWGKLGDIIGDIGLQVQHWFGALDISKHVNNLDEYHKKVIDKNDTTSQRIEEIFTNVKNIDIRYQNGLGQELSYANSITDMIKVLSDTIDPNGGNMNLQKMNEALAASLEKIRENQLSKNKVIEDSMLGTDPDAAEMSADPVNLSTGNFVYDHQDLIVGGEIPLVFHRYYNSKDTRVGTLGKCFLHNYEVLIEDSNDGVLGIRQADGQVIRYEKDNDGNYHSNTSALEILKKTETGYVLENIGKERKLFKSDGKLIRQENWNGRGISFSYNEKNQLVKAKTDNESCFEYFYDESSGYLTKVQDHTGRCVDLTYKNGMLEKVALPLDIVYTYTYGSNGRIIEVVNAREIHAVKNEYDKKYRVTKQFFPDGGMMSFLYDDEKRCVVLTERNGVKTTYFYDENYRNTETVFEDGTSEKFLYNEKNQCISKTDRLGRTQRMAYDNRGNLTQVVDSLKRRINFTYDANNNLISVSMNGKERLKNHYDVKGKLIATENCMKESLWITYDEKQHPVELTFVDGSKTMLSYDERGNISTIREANGNEVHATNQMTASFDLVDGQRKKATYTYNGLGHRVGQKISSLIPEYPEKKIRYTIDMTRQYYNLLQKSEGGASQTYYWDGNVVGMESNGVEKFYLQDDFGSPMHLVDIYGTSQECFAFDEFGENLSTSYNNTSQTFGFTGYQTDEVGDLYYAQARRYDASVGRFVSEDKVRGFVILPYTLNHYGYCWNNPVDFVDRDGNLPTVVIGAVIGLAAGALGEVVSQTIDGVQSGKSVLDSLLDVNPGKVVLEAGKGAVTGAVAGTGAGLLVVAGTSGVVEFGGDLLDQKVLQKKEDLDYTHAISNGLWSATTTLVVGGITNEISNVIHPEAKTGTMDYLFGRDKAKAVVKAQYNNARSSSSRAKYWNRLEKIKLQKTLGTIKYGIIETGKTIIDEIKNEIYRDEVNEDIVEEIDKKISCSVY